MNRYRPGHRVKLSHPTVTDPVGSHSFIIADEDACHFYVIDREHFHLTGEGKPTKVRIDAVLDWPGVDYE